MVLTRKGLFRRAQTRSKIGEMGPHDLLIEAAEEQLRIAAELRRERQILLAQMRAERAELTAVRERMARPRLFLTPAGTNRFRMLLNRDPKGADFRRG